MLIFYLLCYAPVLKFLTCYAHVICAYIIKKLAVLLEYIHLHHKNFNVVIVLL